MMVSDIYGGEKKIFSRVCIALFASFLLAYCGTFALIVALVWRFPDLWDNDWFRMLINNLNTVLAIVLFLTFSIRIPSKKSQPLDRMTLQKAFVFFAVSIALMAVGSLMGNILTHIIGVFLGNPMENVVETMVTDTKLFPLFVSVVIIAPVTEELLFRKILIDKLSRYGTWFSVVFSAVAFGVFHGNFFQFFYASLMGVLLGYIYSIYGKIRYTVAIHMLINLLGSVVALYVSGIAESEQVIHMVITMLYSMFYMSMVIGGITFVAVYARRRYVKSTPCPLQRLIKDIFVNVGVFLLAVYGLVLFALSIFE